MKKTYILPLSAIVLLGGLSLQRSDDFTIEKYFKKNGHINASGAPTSKTGAPGESNCTSCHAGSALDGSTENVFTLLNGLNPVTSYNPGSSYTATVAMSSNPASKGFQATALITSSNAMAGSFTGSTGVTAITSATVSGGARQYANHTSTSNTSSTMFWNWTWTAPATNVGDVKFYVATNKGNGGGGSTGDAIYLSQHTISGPTSAGIEESEAEETSFSAGYSPSTSSLIIDFNTLSIGKMYLNLVDLNGRSVFTYEMGTSQIGENHQEVKLPELKAGIYIVNYFVGNKPMSAKIYIQ